MGYFTIEAILYIMMFMASYMAGYYFGQWWKSRKK